MTAGPVSGQQKVRIVGLEEHMATADVMSAWRRVDPDITEPIMRWTVEGNVAEPLIDLGEQRLHAMDTTGLDRAVLSLTTPGLQNLPVPEAVALQRPTNDLIAEAVRRHPERFGGFATLATPDPEVAAGELERCIVDLGFEGAMLHTLTGDDFPDEPRFWSIFEVAAAHRAPIYLHPSVPPSAVQDAYYRGFGFLGTGGLGWHYQTGLALLRMILRGVFDRFPDLQVILGHWGEVVDFFLERSKILDGDPALTRLDRPLEEYFRNNVYITPGGIASHRYLEFAAGVVGIDRIMSATDYPFVPESRFNAARFLGEARVTDAERACIGSGTWEELSSKILR